MVLSNFLLPLFLIAIYSYSVSCQLDLDTNSLGQDTSPTYVYINSNSALRLFQFASLSISDLVVNSTVVTISTEAGLTQRPCFTQSMTLPCKIQLTTIIKLNLDTALSLLQSIYYENSDPIDGRVVVVTVTVRYQVNVGEKTFETYTQFANVLEKRDKPVISFKDGYEYAPVYNHNLRPVPFLDGDNFTLLSLGGEYTSLLVCVLTQSELESISVDTDHPRVDSPVSINQIDRVCSRVNFSSIDNTTLLQVFAAFTYSETTEIIDNYNDRVISVSVDTNYSIGDPLYFNLTYYITVIPTPIYIQTLPVVYYEDVGTQVVPDLSSVKLSDVINVSRQYLTDLKPITSLLFQANSSHIPKVNLWNDQMCSSSWLTHPVHKFEFCTDEQFFFNLELTSAFQLKFNPTSETILVEGRDLIIYNATELPMYGFITFVGSETQNPEANHFSIWFKNAPGELTGCPLEITNGPQVDYQVCLSGSDSTIEFWYSGLAPEHHEVRVTYPTEGAFRLDDWNYVSVSVTVNSIHLLLNELELAPSEFYWFDLENVDNFTQIPIHLYSTSRNSITQVYILGKNSGFIGEVTGVIVDQFFISTREAYCMFSCIEGFYMNESIIDILIEMGLQINFVRESFEVTGNMSVSDVAYILHNLYYNTPVNSPDTYRNISSTVSDDLFTSTDVTRISFRCVPGSCSNNSYCYSTESADICLCKEGYLDASAEGNMSVCKHPMDCSYMNGGCGELETCLQMGEEVRECEDICDSSPCLNGGTCNIISVTEYECVCVGEFYGFDCECRNNCLIIDCSPGSCVDYCNGSTICVSPPSSSIPIPTSTLLSTASRVMTSSFYSSQLSSSQLQTSSVVPASSQLVSSSALQESPTPVSSYTMTSSFSGSQLTSSLLQTSSIVPSSSLPVSSSVLSESSTSVYSTMTSSYFSSQSSSLLQSSSFVASSSTPASSSVTDVMTSSSILPTSSLIEYSSVTEVVTSSLIPVVDMTTSSSVVSIIASSQLLSSASDIISSSQVASSYRAIITSSQIPSSSRAIITSSQVASSSSAIITSSQIPSSSRAIITSSQVASSSSAIITSSQIPSSSSAIIMSSQIPSSSSAIIMSSQIPSSSSAIIMSSQIPSSSSAIIMSSQIPSSSSDVITSSQLLYSSSGIIMSSQLASSSSDMIMSSQVASISSDIISSSQIPSSSSDVITSSQMPSTSSDIIPSSQIPSTSSDMISSSQLLSSSSDIIPSSQIPSSSSDVITSSQLLSSSAVDMTTSSELPSSSVANVITSSQLLSSSSDVITSQLMQSSSVSTSQILSSSTDVMTSSHASISSEPILTSSVVSTSVTSSSVMESSVESSSDFTPPSSSVYPSPTVIGSTTDPHPTISVQPMNSSSSLNTTLISSAEPSISILNTDLTANVSSTAIPTNPPTLPPEVTEANSVQIAIGIGVGILILILVIILAIALIFALFLHRTSRHQDLDPTKEFDNPHSTCPAEITAVFKNKETSIIN